MNCGLQSFSFQTFFATGFLLALQTHRKMLGGALGLATANHKQLLNPNSPIDLEAWRDALLQSTKNQVRQATFYNGT